LIVDCWSLVVQRWNIHNAHFRAKQRFVTHNERSP
jgi:hypothetical protein